MEKEHIVIGVIGAVAFLILGIAVGVFISQSIAPTSTAPTNQVVNEEMLESTTPSVSSTSAAPTTTMAEQTTVPTAPTTSASTSSSVTVATTLSTSTTVMATTTTTSTTTTVLQPQVVMIGSAWRCVDSDGGENYYLRGTITMNDRTVWTDTCLNPSEIQESFCDSTRLKTGYRSVVYDCPNGCFEGACIANETTKKIVWVSNNTTTYQTYTTTTLKLVTTTSSSTTTTFQGQVVQIANGLFCRDTDGGRNYNLTGVVTVNDQVVWTDTCLNPSELQEGYCDKSTRKYYRVEVIECLNRCSIGACV